MGNGQKVPTLIGVFGKVRVLIGFAWMAWVLVNVVTWNLAADVGWLPRWLALMLATLSLLIVGLPGAFSSYDGGDGVLIEGPIHRACR